MIKINHHIKIQHETFGELLNEMFIDSIQFQARQAFPFLGRVETGHRLL